MTYEVIGSGVRVALKVAGAGGIVASEDHGSGVNVKSSGDIPEVVVSGGKFCCCVRSVDKECQVGVEPAKGRAASEVEGSGVRVTYEVVGSGVRVAYEVWGS